MFYPTKLNQESIGIQLGNCCMSHLFSSAANNAQANSIPPKQIGSATEFQLLTFAWPQSLSAKCSLTEWSFRQSLTWVLQSRSLWREIASAQTSSVSAIASGYCYDEKRILRHSSGWKFTDQLKWTDRVWQSDATVGNNRFLEATLILAGSDLVE